MGVAFYVMRRVVPFARTVWHLFVLGGSICHGFCVLLHVIPRA